MRVLNEALDQHRTPAVLLAIAEVLEDRVGDGFPRVQQMRRCAARKMRKLSDETARIISPDLDLELTRRW